MVYSTPKKRVFFTRSITPVLLGLLGVFSLLVLNMHTPQIAEATASTTVNFQARLQTAGGAIVPDGNYNIEFKLYDASSSSGSSQGSCTGDAHCLWVEDRTGGNVVTVQNGYVNVRLGSVSAFSGTIDWSQQLYLTMNIGGTGSPSWDGEMNPRLSLTASPYAFDSNEIGGLTASQLGQLAANQTWTGVNTFQNSSTAGLQVQDSSNSAHVLTVDTSGDVVDIGSNASLVNPAQLYVKNTNSSNRALLLQGASGQSVDILDIYNSGGQFVSGYDVSGNEYLNGSLNTGTTSAAGSVAIKDGTVNNRNVTITSQALTNSYALYLPASGVSGSQCVQSTSGSTTSSTTLQFGSCGVGSVSTAPTTTLQNTISPATSAVVGLTVNGTSTGTAAQALIVNQAQGADAVNVNITGSSQTNGILVNRTNSGTLTNGIQIENTSGTVTNGLTFTGTFATNLINAPNFVITNAGAITSGSINWSGAIATSGNISTSGSGTITSAGLLTASGGITDNGAMMYGIDALGNIASNGAIGTAAATVDAHSSFTITQTTASVSATIPSPTTSTAAHDIYISSLSGSSQNITVGGVVLTPGTTTEFLWNGAAWTAASTLSTSGVTAATYGSASQVAQFTVNAQGLVTSASNVSISITNSNLQSGAYGAITSANNMTSASSLATVGALASGSIASGFGTISTGNSIATTSSIQGGSVTSTGIFATQEGTTFTTAGTSTNAALNGTSAYLLNTSGAAQIIQGITAGVNGQNLTLTNSNASNNVTLANNSGSATGSKIITGTGSDYILSPGASASLIYDSANSVWRVIGTTAVTAVTTVGAISGTSNANGATITGNTINLTVADGTNGGVVSNTTQTLAGAKTFSALITGNAGLSVSGGNISIGDSSHTTTITGTTTGIDANTTLNLGTSTARTIGIGNNNSSTVITSTAGATVLTQGNSGATLKTTTNSTTALQIQDATGASFLTANSTNDSINTQTLNVGSATNEGSAGRLFNDGFESNNFELWNNDVAVNGTSVSSIVTSPVHGGKYAAKVNMTGTGNTYFGDTFGGSNTTLDTRLYVNFASQGATNLNFLYTIDGPDANEQDLYLNSSGDVCWWNGKLSTGTCSSTVLSFGTWYQIELDTVIGSSGSANVYVNGTNILSRTGVNTGSNPLTIVYSGDGTSGDIGVYEVDDISVDTVSPGAAAGLNVGDSFHVSGSSSFGSSVVIQPAGGTLNALLVQNTSGGTVLNVDTDDNCTGLGAVACGANGEILTLNTGTNQYGLIQTDGTTTVGTYVGSGIAYYGTKSNSTLGFFTNDGANAETINTDGTAAFKDYTDSTTAFQVSNHSGNALLTVDTSNTAIVLGKDTTPAAITVRGGAASGTNVAGGNITLQASNGTGTGGAGSLNYQTGAAATAPPITLDNTAAKTFSSGSTSYTSNNFTVGSHSNMLMIVQLVTGCNETFSNVAFGGTSMGSPLDSGRVNSLVSEAVYSLAGANIPSGTHTLTYNTSASTCVSGYTITTYYNVNTASPFGTEHQATITNASSLTNTIAATSTTQLVYDAVADDSLALSAPQTSYPQTVVSAQGGSATQYGFATSTQPGINGNVTTTWGTPSNIDSIDIGVPINQASTSGSSTADTMNTVLSIGNTGAVTLQNNTNSTAAFQIQNSSASTIVNVDTTNSKTTFTNSTATTSNVSTSSGLNWDNGGTNVTTVAVTPSAVGDIMLVAACECGSGNHTTGISGGGVLNWTQLVYTTSSNGTFYRLWEGKITSTVASTVTISWSGTPGTTTEVNAQEFSSSYGPNATWSFVNAVEQHNISGGTSTVTYPTQTATAAGQAYWGYMVTGAASINNGCTTGTGFTCIQTSTGHNGAAWNTSLAANTSYAPTQTSNANATSGGVGVILSALPPTVNTALQISSTGTSAFQVQNASGTSMLNADTTTGALTIAGGLTGGEYNSGTITDAFGIVYNVGVDALVYNFSTTSGTTATAATSTFNVTGLPAVDGTVAYFTVTTAKGSTGATSITHTVVAQINGVTISTVACTSTNTTASNTRSFTVARINGVWAVVGSGLSSSPSNASSTVNTADYAEWIDYSGDTAPQPGDVLTIGDSATSVKDSMAAYDSHAIGVVSTSPYAVGGADDGHSVVMALTGRVPVNVSLENGPIEPGDPLTSSSTPGVAMKATSAGHIIGTALEAYDGTQSSNQINVQLHAGYDDPNPGTIQGDANISGGMYVGGDANIEGNLTVAGTTSTQDLNVSGTTSLAVLTVSGGISADGVTVVGAVSGASLAISGNASFGGDITLSGHFITGGTAPTTAVNTAVAGSTATCTVAGNDTSGTITLQSQGTGQAAGSECTLTFSKAFGGTPRTVLSPNDSGSAAMGAYIQATSTTMTLNFTGVPVADQTYNYNYFDPQ